MHVCYSTQMISTKGIIFRNMGCRDAAMCKHGIIVGKRSIYNRKSMVNVDKFDESVEVTSNKAKMAEVRSLDKAICDECCNSDLCQTSLCSDKGASQLGPVCFNCDAQSPSDPCMKIDRCDADESCYQSFSTHHTSGTLLRSGCVFTSTCGHFHIPETTTDVCWRCCDNDLCNANCTSIPYNNAHTTKGPCVDRSSTVTCELASSIACSDKDKASHAGCSHFCGFC
ncbi:uncharacterized protein LOC132760097 [Ruditapes philippinarum]|uniref:uncharacterized protein LOC132760097 n=1 Tax=Ruditapes philippinarum TaxID=129788 RepID=UPI00295B1163|nr:uncharacterized protein LOC132760097 [Ruditapes philippinarum]